tara:strand:- start:1137 stop:1385 length:249 start_codon:yes stop_codon:yes gene_type:complete
VGKIIKVAGKSSGEERLKLNEESAEDKPLVMARIPHGIMFHFRRNFPLTQVPTPSEFDTSEIFGGDPDIFARPQSLTSEIAL